MADAWTANEIETALTDYFAMLSSELVGDSYNKAQHNRELRSLLNDRSRGSVERKHQNVSAVLVEMNLPYIDGYKPLRNYQHALRDAVAGYVRSNPEIVHQFLGLAMQGDFAEQTVVDPSLVVVEAPVLESVHTARVSEAIANYGPVDFVAIEARNARLGECGEKFTIEFEKARLRLAGHDDLAKEVEWVAHTKGAGAGFDVASFDSPDERRLIEVKTTNYGRSFPFYISRNELEFSRVHEEHYKLYRVFHYRLGPKLFILGGKVERHCLVEPETFKAGFGSAVA
jgi:hypothetical protein